MSPIVPDPADSDDEHFLESVIESYRAVGKNSDCTGPEFDMGGTATTPKMLGTISLAEARLASKINKRMEQDGDTVRFLNDYIPRASISA
jgi:hypothetical protein